MYNRIPGVVLIMVVFAWVGHAAEEAVGPLGSRAFRASPDRPVGWRGDWTGRFPGATPPIEWSRRIKGATTDIRYQADKPDPSVDSGHSGKPDAGSRPLEYFTIKDWLVAGPFVVDDPAKGIDKDFLGGEAEVTPAAGARAGGATWRALHVGIGTQARHEHNDGTCGDSNVDFVYVYGNLPPSGAIKTLEAALDNKVAYAHTYVHSPAGGEFHLRVNYAGAALKVLLNGQVVAIPRSRTAEVSLKKGWNRLLLKVASDKAAVPRGQNPWVSRWRVAAYIEPALPVCYETKNVAWMTPMTGRSMSQPILVGDRIYVGSGMTDLLCIDRETGRIAWLRTNTPYDAMTDEQRASTPAIRDKVAPLAARLEALSGEAVKAINAAVSATGLPSDRQAELGKLLKARADAEKAVHDAFAAIDRRKYPQMYRNEVSSSNATPCSDGRHVYWACGGGMKGPGSHVIACFDLDGRRIWSWHDGGSLGAPEHGCHMSPNLVDGKLIYAANMTLMALDAGTGKELWRNSPDDWQNGGHGSTSPQVVRINGTRAILHMRYIHRASDGTVICPSNVDLWGVHTPVIQDGVIYNPAGWRGFDRPAAFLAVKLPVDVGQGAKTQVVLALDGEEATMPVRMRGPIFMVASPLYVNGVVYSVEMGGGVTAVDTAAGRCLFRQYLDGYNRYDRFLYGVAASPALAGGRIYITDDAGCTHILQPGAKLKELRRNILENIHLSSRGRNPCKQESFYTSPWFEGRRMYLRGEEYLYCIRQDQEAAR